MGPEWTRHAVARLSWSGTSGTWTLHEITSDGRFHRTRWCAPSPDVGNLLAAIDEDPTGIFWG